MIEENNDDSENLEMEDEADKKRKKEKLPPRRSLSKNKALPPEDHRLADTSDAKAMLRRIAEMFDDLENRLEYIHQNIHVLPKELQKFLTHPEEVIKNHDQLVEEYERRIEEKLITILGDKNFGLERKRRMNKKVKKRGRKAQKLRGQKKWIPMD